MVLSDFCNMAIGVQSDIGEGFEVERLSSFGREQIERFDYQVSGLVNGVRKSAAVGIFRNEIAMDQDVNALLKEKWREIYG